MWAATRAAAAGSGAQCLAASGCTVWCGAGWVGGVALGPSVARWSRSSAGLGVSAPAPRGGVTPRRASGRVGRGNLHRERRRDRSLVELEPSQRVILPVDFDRIRAGIEGEGDELFPPAGDGAGGLRRHELLGGAFVLEDLCDGGDMPSDAPLLDGPVGVGEDRGWGGALTSMVRHSPLGRRRASSTARMVSSGARRPPGKARKAKVLAPPRCGRRPLPAGVAAGHSRGNPSRPCPSP